MKRLFDIIMSLAGLFLLLPLFIIVALIIKMDSAGPVFFLQQRIGRNLRPFNLYKFRTMVADARNKGLAITAGDDPRVTRVGRFLRKMKIDEFPQLINVVRGDMSIVGSRPEVPKYVSLYVDDYREILKARPGITDIASLKYSDEEAVLKDRENPEDYYIHVLLPEKIKLAKEYARRASLLYDLRLIALTILKVAYPQNLITRAINSIIPFRRTVVVGLQVLVFYFSNYLAYYIRFDGNIPLREIDLFLKYLPLLLVLRIVFLFVFSLDKALWRYTGVRDVLNVIFSTSLGTLSFVFCVRYIFDDPGYSRTVYILDWMLNVFLLAGIRGLRRLHEKTGRAKTNRKRIIVVGAGSTSEMLIRDLEHSSSYPYRIIGLIDDDPKKKGLKMRNIPILGTMKDIRTIVEKEYPEEFLVALPSISGSELQDMVKELRQFGLPVKTMPGLWSVLNGSERSDLEPEDVLFRSPVSNGSENLESFFKGRRVMITGAGGSIGSELSRQAASFGPASLVLFERHEENLYRIDMELRTNRESEQTIEINSVIGDILDEKRVDAVMDKYRPEIVLHAAAYKHVPLMEDNPHEALKTNVLGTKIVAGRSGEHGVERFILISTDKAVNPANVMGMTKKMAEEIVRSLSVSARTTRYITVRFGNVLESSGSVVPLFKEQIRRGGPVTVTHPDITRYFMTIPEAVGLVLQAAAMGRGGEVFVLDMGKPVKIVDLAKRMIGLYGYKPGVDIDISFIGLRPGEKLYEELFNGNENIEKTSHPKINRAVSKRQTVSDVSLETVNGLFDIADGVDIREAMRSFLGEGK